MVTGAPEEPPPGPNEPLGRPPAPPSGLMAAAAAGAAGRAAAGAGGAATAALPLLLVGGGTSSGTSAMASPTLALINLSIRPAMRRREESIWAESCCVRVGVLSAPPPAAAAVGCGVRVSATRAAIRTAAPARGSTPTSFTPPGSCTGRGRAHLVPAAAATEGPAAALLAVPPAAVLLSGCRLHTTSSCWLHTMLRKLSSELASRLRPLYL
mmetsp:Transcript_20198/g.44049  ORF Transcript_20198/g.44049 Transcript_20198/m.44049 type:complete len:211 (+) Transcript_20198:1660-2292(+)